MTKKNIRPQQVAPVQRETTATAVWGGGRISPSIVFMGGFPFAGDDAE